MTVTQLIRKLDRLDPDLDIYVLLKGDSDEYEILDVKEGELQDDETDESEPCAFVLC